MNKFVKESIDLYIIDLSELVYVWVMAYFYCRTRIQIRT